MSDITGQAPLGYEQAETNQKKIVRVAVVQHEPVHFDLKASVEKAIQIIDEAAQKGAKLIAFPEVWLPGYPAWICQDRARPADLEAFELYFNNSMTKDSVYMKALQETAARNQIAVVMGYSEKDGGSLYISQAFLNPQGSMACHRRKLRPTHMERTVYGDGGGASLLNVMEMPGIGLVGGLCCWEHTQPLLKYHTHSQKEQVHIAAWPPQVLDEGRSVWSVSAEASRHMSRIYALEGGCFVLQAHSVMSQKGIDIYGTQSAGQFYKPGGGGSCIIGPDGVIIAEGNYGVEEELIIADLDLGLIAKAKALIDTHGHYSRPDLLSLKANTTDALRVISGTP